jgi:hypothetical protein
MSPTGPIITVEPVAFVWAGKKGVIEGSWIADMRYVHRPQLS